MNTERDVFGRCRLLRDAALGFVVALVLIGLCVTSATADGPAWEIDAYSAPTYLEPGKTGEYRILVRNTTDRATFTSFPDGSPNRLSVRLPVGLRATSIANDPLWVGKGAVWSCDLATLMCETSDVVEPLRTATPIIVTFDVDAGTSGTARAEFTASGGGARAATLTSLESPITTERPTFGVVPGTFVADAYDRNGNQERQAGAHPFRAVVSFDLNIEQRIGPPIFPFPGAPDLVWTEPVDTLRMVEVDLPRGFIGNPEAVPQCTVAQMIAPDVGCPANAQVGVVDVATSQSALATQKHLPVFNMVPPRGVVADFAFSINANPVHIRASLNPKDYSIRTTVGPVTELETLRGQKLTLWGVPADEAHDADRFLPGKTNAGQPNPADPFGPDIPLPSTAPKIPFLTLPSECGTPGITKLRITSWDEPDRVLAYDSEPQYVTGCERQQFEAWLRGDPDSKKTDTATGLSVDLDARQFAQPRSLGAPPLRKATVTLPEGVSVSPSSANGLWACAPAQIKLGTNDEPTCPDPSNIGSVKISTPLLPDPLEGAVYLATQNDNPFSSLLAIYIVAKGPGVIIKLPGRIETDAQTGRVTATFDNNPQLPFTNLNLRFTGGPLGSLATPQACGTGSTETTLVSWNPMLPPATSSSPVTFSADGNGAPCPNPQSFEPGFEAGSVNTAGGAKTPFTATFTRPDQHQYLSDIEVSTPPGLAGYLARKTLCTDRAASAGTCGQASRIGRVTVAAGPGSSPFWLDTGRVYITESYKGAPFGMSIVVPAVAGPFNLGTVVVRAAIHVDRRTAALRVVSDPMPTILQGIPLRVRTVNVAIDDPGFMFNPTNCAPTQVSGVIGSITGAKRTRSTRYQVGSCSDLPFGPRLSFRVGARGRTGTNMTTPLTATLAMPRGNQANNRSVEVILPKTLNSRLRIVNRACTLAAYDAGRCGAGARIGSAWATTPVLRDPLRGSVYFVRNPARRLPDIMVALRGQVAIDVTAKVSIPRDLSLRTTFDTVPDVPVDKFTLNFVSGANAPLGVVNNLCTARARRASVARLVFRGQGGRVIRRNQKLQIVGCGRAARRGAAGSRAGRRSAGRRAVRRAS